VIEFEDFFPGHKQEGFKIATIYADGELLNDALCSIPTWWNWTAKSRTIAGIVFCLQYIIYRVLLDGSDHSV
jgi:hypothetical protein